jgi:hypothetical protein
VEPICSALLSCFLKNFWILDNQLLDLIIYVLRE